MNTDRLYMHKLATKACMAMSHGSLRIEWTLSISSQSEEPFVLEFR